MSGIPALILSPWRVWGQLSTLSDNSEEHCVYPVIPWVRVEGKEIFPSVNYEGIWGVEVKHF
jgi:hypothetical protein